MSFNNDAQNRKYNLYKEDWRVPVTGMLDEHVVNLVKQLQFGCVKAPELGWGRDDRQ